MRIGFGFPNDYRNYSYLENIDQFKGKDYLYTYSSQRLYFTFTVILTDDDINEKRLVTVGKNCHHGQRVDKAGRCRETYSY